MMNAQLVEINNCWTEEFSKQQTGCSERWA